MAVLHEPRAEGRHLREDDFAGEAVVLELLDAHIGVELAAARREGARLVAEHAHDLVVAELDRAREGLHPAAALARLLGVGSTASWSKKVPVRLIMSRAYWSHQSIAAWWKARGMYSL